MSRPKGSKNKIKKKKTIKVKKVKRVKRGRPKGSKTKKNLFTESHKPTYKSYKYLGNCPRCKVIITSSDLVSKHIFICKSCGKRSHTNKIKIKVNKRPSSIYLSKKEYLESTIENNQDNIVPVNDKSELIDIKAIRLASS